MGRSGSFLKLNRCRIELQQIDRVILEDENVREANKQDPRGGRSAVGAYVVSEGRSRGRCVGAAELRGRQTATLMVPRAVVTIERLPLTNSGKVDPSGFRTPAAEGAPNEPTTFTRDVLQQPR